LSAELDLRSSDDVEITMLIGGCQPDVSTMSTLST